MREGSLNLMLPITDDKTGNTYVAPIHVWIWALFQTLPDEWLEDVFLNVQQKCEEIKNRSRIVRPA